MVKSVLTASNARFVQLPEKSRERAGSSWQIQEDSYASGKSDVNDEPVLGDQPDTIESWSRGGMNWTKPRSRPSGFNGAEAVLLCETHLLALWNHHRCHGWQLYACFPPKHTRTRWLAGAGGASVDWTDEQAIKWAEGQIAAAQPE